MNTLTEGQIRYRKYKDSYRKYRLKFGKNAKDKNRFGGNRETVLQRDNWKCVECGMSQEKHYVLFNRSLTIDHIDGMGRCSNIQNNNMENLQTLCLRCHGKKDHKRKK